MNQLSLRLIKWFKPAQGRVLVEQLKLVAKHQVAGVVPVGIGVVLLWWMLFDQVDNRTLSVWAMLMIAGLRITYLHARNNLSNGITPERAPKIVKRLMLERIFYSTSWGCVGVLSLGETSANVNFLVLSMIAGMTSGAMSAFAPVLILFVVTVVPVITLITWKVILLNDPSYYALAITFVLYVFALLAQAFQSSKETRAAIDLRFENVELLSQLKEKAELAEAARRDAEDANAAKSMFLASASHDLRQPIHAQGLFLDVLSRTTLDARQQGLVSNIIAAREASSEMLNTLLDFSRIEAGVIDPQIQAFYVQPILNKIEREFSPQADSKGLTYRSRESTCAVVSDPSLVEIILRNLVSNAIKYTRNGGVLVNFRRVRSAGVFEVWDTGIGIDASQYDSIFREFHQLGNPQRERSNGLGLGLAIAQGLAHSLNVRLSLRSTVGRGSVFCLELPLVTHQKPSVTSAYPLRDVFLPKVKVLVLDDDPVICAGMVQLLSDWGCVCGSAQTIDEAKLMAVNMQPDVVISDYRLRQDHTGVQAICALREITGVSLPAILITGDTGPERLREAMSSGIPVLHKPVSAKQLMQAMASILAGAHSP